MFDFVAAPAGPLFERPAGLHKTCVGCSRIFVDDRQADDFASIHVPGCVDFSSHCTVCYVASINALSGWCGLSARFHWIAFTSRLVVAETLLHVSRAVYSVEVDGADAVYHDLGRGGMGYANQLVGPCGVRVFYTSGREDCHVVIPGSACDFSYTRPLLRLFEVPAFTFKRTDFALDGVRRFDAPLCPRWVFDQCRTRPESIRTRAKLAAAADPLSGLRPESYSLTQGPNGSTAYIGSPSSERRLRVYDSRGFTRMELQVREKRCVATADMLNGKPVRNFGAFVVGLISGFIDFVDVSAASNISRAPLQDWWASVVHNAPKVCPPVDYPIPRLESTWMFFRRQWGPFVALCMKAAGGDWDVFYKLVEEGSMKLGPRHDLQLKAVGGVGGWTPNWS